MANSTFDLVLERVVPITAAQLWQGWTHAETLKKWFTPAPWITSEVEIDAQTHAKLGFEAGWGAALDQLVVPFA